MLVSCQHSLSCLRKPHEATLLSFRILIHNYSWLYSFFLTRHSSMQKHRTIHVTVLRQTKNYSKKSKVWPKVRVKHQDATWTIPSATSQLTSIMIPATPTVNSGRLQRASAFPCSRSRRAQTSEEVCITNVSSHYPFLL